MLTSTQYRLINGRVFDAVPASLYRAKANAQARQLAQSDWLIRQRENGRYIATASGNHTHFFHRASAPQSRLDAVHDVFDSAVSGESHLPLYGLSPLWAELALDADTYADNSGLAAIAEPVQLEYAGRDAYKRPLWLDYDTAKAWTRLQTRAARDGIPVFAISGYRSAHYQMGIFRRKLARGLSLEDILKVNAAPGFSEHHSGRAIDIGTAGEPAAEQSFELTPAFGWLSRYAGDFGFRMSFPRDNTHGIGYEPWHWYWLGPDQP